MFRLIPTPYKYLAVAVAVGLLALGAKLYISSVEQGGYNRGRAELQAELDAKSLELALAYAERIKLAEEKRDENQNLVDKLSADVRRLRIKHPTPRCSATSAGEDQSGTAGAFSETLDRAFANLQQGTTDLVSRCDELNLDAIEANTARGN